MKLQIKTSKLQEMLSKAIKGVSNDKLLPITSLISVELEDSVLTLTTTDFTTYMYVREGGITGDNFAVTVNADQLHQLVSRMTCDSLTLELNDTALVITGNGTYKLAITLDEESQPVEFPNPLAGFKKETQIGTLSQATIKSIIGSLKSSLATSLTYPWYTNYYLSDVAVTTDTNKLTRLNKPTLSVATLVSPEVMTLLDVFYNEPINAYLDGKQIVFDSQHISVYSVAQDGITEFNIDMLNELINQEFTSMCKVSKSAILQLLDRVALFVDVYDDGAINLQFTKDGLIVSSKASTGTEIIPYLETSNFVDFDCAIDILTLTPQIKAQATDIIEIWYGLDNAIKLENADVVSIVSLLTED